MEILGEGSDELAFWLDSEMLDGRIRPSCGRPRPTEAPESRAKSSEACSASVNNHDVSEATSTLFDRGDRLIDLVESEHLMLEYAQV